jgi:hypothetical protein
MFLDIFNADTLQQVKTAYKCPLMRLMSMTIIPDEYNSGCAPFWIFQRIDEICKALGLTEYQLGTELQRIALASFLEKVYSPFFIYLINDTDAYHCQRNLRYNANIYWHCLHKFLCSRVDGDVYRCEELVEQFIEDRKSYGWDHQEYKEAKKIYFNKYSNSRPLEAMYTGTDNPRYLDKWLD